MRKLIVCNIISLDGFYAGPGGESIGNGGFFLIAQADPTNAIKESNERNNAGPSATAVKGQNTFTIGVTYGFTKMVK